MKGLAIHHLISLLIIGVSVVLGDNHLRSRELYDHSSSGSGSSSYDDHYEDKNDKSCPIVTALGPKQFDLDTYIQRSWFIQKQVSDAVRDMATIIVFLGP